MTNLILGTAQLGIDYGIINERGLPSEVDVFNMLSLALKLGIKEFDTAQEYGLSELRIGKFLSKLSNNNAQIITKLRQPNDQVLHEEIGAWVSEQINKSLKNLNKSKIDYLLLHHWEDYKKFSGNLWLNVRKNKYQGVINKIGVSLYHPNQLIQALNDKDIQIIQFPFNILDWRWIEAIKKINEIKCKRSLTIHVRSIYLQGLLLTSDFSHWSLANNDDPSRSILWLHNLTKQLNRASVADLCIAFVKSLKWIDGIIIGMENVNQLRENYMLFNKPSLSKVEIEHIMKTRPILKENTLNPSMWKR